MFGAARRTSNAHHNLEDRYSRLHWIGLPLLASLYPVTVAVTQTGFVYVVAAVPLRPRDVDRSRDQYRAIAQWIDHDSTKPHPTVATIEIGQLGYYGRADIVDCFGLLDTSADDAIRRRAFSWWPSKKPDYWVTAKTAIDSPTLTRREFRDAYTSAAVFGPLTVYWRTTSVR